MSSLLEDQAEGSPQTESSSSINKADQIMKSPPHSTVILPDDNDDFHREATPPADTPDDLDEESALKNLNATARDQDDLERDITHQANLALIEAEDNKDRGRIAKAEASKSKYIKMKQAQKERLNKARNNIALKNKVQQEIARIDAEVELIDKDISDFNTRIEERNRAGLDESLSAASATGRLPGETQRDFLIRTGKITPFAKIGGPRPEGVEGELANAIIEAEDTAAAEELQKQGANGPRSHRNLRLPGFAEDQDDVTTTVVENEFSLRPRKKRKVVTDAASSDEFEPASAASPDSTGASDDDYDMTELTRVAPRKTSKRSRTSASTGEKIDFGKIDDGNESAYQERVADWVERRSRARKRKQEREGISVDEDDGEEWFKPSPDEPDHHFENGLKLPGDIYPSLFDYQKTGVQWLAELFEQQVGGIVGDEMGLGKTIQIIAFIAALHYSKKLAKPVLIVAPATVLQQWVNEFHRWWPPLRVSILHSSGSGMLNVRSEGRYEDEDLWDEESRPKRSSKAVKKVVDRVVEHGHVLITTYAGLQTYGDVLVPINWGYAVLDEGHKIRNPDTSITIYCKELLTPNRIILSGTPMQNNLVELWSIFDFVNPMRLGSLIEFRKQFELPIKIGGYVNASNLQILTAQKCAATLKDAISPYLLQRTKKDVAADLPQKKEQVLFCNLTRFQRGCYEQFIRSNDMSAILNRTRKAFCGIDHLRKICNHPDLAIPSLKDRPGYKWGSSAHSGKMIVVKDLLNTWKRFGHKTLLFCQGVQMLDIMEAFIKRQNGITYLRMDGKTPIKERQKLVDRFNNESGIDLFLLTTKVGGLGVNLTGANRVIIYDPDWNPSTDIQARERAWRLGQKKEVTIYRLMTSGTIEEKIYQRQVFKQFLANKVLKDSKQSTNLNLGDLQDLFSLGAADERGTETGKLFKGSESDIKSPSKPKVTPGAGLYDLEDQRARIEGMVAAQKKEQEDLRKIEGVTGLEDYNAGDDNSPDEEDRIMAGIFAKGVHESLEHESIVNGKKVVQADREVLESMAERTAAEASNHLNRMAEQAGGFAIGTVTWTGQNGEAGRPRQPNAQRGPGSASVIANIRRRQGRGIIRSNSPPAARTPRTVYGFNEFKEMIPPFIRRHGGMVPSKVILDHFNGYCGDNRRASDAFVKALKMVANLNRSGSSMRGIWSLKPKYQ